jgi:hypothetical protein
LPTKKKFQLMKNRHGTHMSISHQKLLQVKKI